MRQFYFIFLWFLLTIPQLLFAKTTIYHENFSGTITGLTNGTNGWNPVNITPSTYPKASGSTYLATGSTMLMSTTYIFTLANSISTVGYQAVHLSWGGKKTGNNVVLQYSKDGGTSYTTVSGWADAGTGWGIINNGSGILLPPACENVPDLRLRWSYTSSILNFTSTTYALDDILISADPIVGTSQWKWANRPVNEDPFVVSSPASENPYIVDGVIMHWAKSVSPGVSLSESAVSTRFQSQNSLSLVQSGASGSLGSVVNITFNQSLKDFSFTLFDLDNSSGQFQDIIVVTGYAGSTVVNANKNKVQTTQNNEFVSNQIRGLSTTGDVAVSSSEADVTYTFPSAVNRVQITLLNGDASRGNQAIGISNLSWQKVSDFTLPVSLVSFKASEENKAIALKWKTAQEVNNDRFEVERSKNGINFQPIGTMKGCGNSLALNYYCFHDKNPSPGLNYYRLKQIDFTGKFEYSTIISVRTNRLETNDLKAFPNPATAVLNLIYPQPTNDPVKVSIKNMAGITFKTINTNGNEQEQTLSISDLPAGIYFIQVENNEQKSITKFIKN